MPSQRFPDRKPPARGPHHDMALAATLVLFGLLPLMIVAGFLAMQAALYLAR